MTRFLLCCDAYQGHINPNLPLVKELIVRGHEVIYYTLPGWQNVIQATGAQIREFTTAHLAKKFQMIDTQSSFLEYHFMALKEVVQAIEHENIDVIVYDSMCLWGKLLAKILAIPAIRLHVTFPISEAFTAFNPFSPVIALPSEKSLRGIIEYIRRVCSLPTFDYYDMYLRPEPLNIVFLPRAFHPTSEQYDERFQFVGPTLLPSKNEPMLDRQRERRLIYASLGSVKNNNASFYDICLTALGSNKQQQLVVAIGNTILPEIFGPLPENVHMSRHVTQLEVLQRANAFVTHGGTNSVMEAIYYQVPLVVVPVSREHKIVARRVQELKLGIAFADIDEITSYTLRAAVERVQEDNEIRDNIAWMRETLEHAGGVKRAADLITHCYEDGRRVSDGELSKRSMIHNEF